jgi:NADH-quinone oxidoreductase subunit L
VFVVFHREPSASATPLHHPHEAPSLMRVPLVILAGLSVVAGFIGIPIIEGAHLLRAYLDPVFTRYALPAEVLGHTLHRPGLEVVMLLISLALAIGGIVLALYMYLIDTTLPERLSTQFQWAYRVLRGKYFVDELYDRLVVVPIKRASDWLWAKVDVGIVDGAVNHAGAFVRQDSAWLSLVQSGFVRNYALSIFLGAVVVIGYFVIR